MSVTLISKAIRKALPGEEPVCFSNVSEALAYAGQVSVDVAFLDIEIGNISGLVLAKELYKIKPDTNIIFVAGYPNYMDEAFELYASGYVRKPPRVERIQKEMTNLRYQLLDSAISRQSKSVDAFTFDHTSQQVYQNGKDILLKPKEYKIFNSSAANQYTHSCQGIYLA